MGRPIEYYRACGDVVAICEGGTIKKVLYCTECYEELRFGTIPPPPTAPPFQSLASHLTKRQCAKLGSTS